MKRLFVLAFVVLAGCGSAYISPTVQEVSKNSGADISVKVIQLTPASIRAANRSRYVPKRLPKAFEKLTAMPVVQVSAPDLPQPPVQPENRPKHLEMRLPPALDPGPYRLGIGDVILLKTSTLSSSADQPSIVPGTPGIAPSMAAPARPKPQQYTVQDDGTIAIPDIGRVNVAGLTVSEAEAEIFKALAKNQITLRFGLDVAGFNSKRVVIGGAVGQPGVVPIRLQPLHLGEALQLAGGITAKDQDYATIRLYRDGKLYQIPVTRFLMDPKLQKLVLKDGDSIYVDTEFDLGKAQAYFAQQIQMMDLDYSARSRAQKRLDREISRQKARLDEIRANFQARVALDAVPRDYVYLAGEVVKQGRFTLPFNRRASLADALFSSSGITTQVANVSQIYVLRGNRKGNSVTAYQLDARNIAYMVMATKMELRPNDIIFVAEQPVTKWNRTVSQIGPSFIQAFAARIK